MLMNREEHAREAFRISSNLRWITLIDRRLHGAFFELQSESDQAQKRLGSPSLAERVCASAV